MQDAAVDPATVERWAKARPNVDLHLLDDDHQLMASLDYIWAETAFLRFASACGGRRYRPAPFSPSGRGAPEPEDVAAARLDRVAGVDDQVRLRHHRVVVERLVVGDDDDAVVLARTTAAADVDRLDVVAAATTRGRALRARTDRCTTTCAPRPCSSPITSSAGDSRMSSMSRL